MKEKLNIKLIELIGDPSAFGNTEGREVFQKLMAKLDANPEKLVINISLSGITRTDASFPRESVVSLAKLKQGEKGFTLSEFGSEDLIDNWDYAAIAKDQNLIVLKSNGYQILGPKISDGLTEVFELILKSKQTTTGEVAKSFDITSQNASAKLKKLMSMGLILGTKRVADSGGLEFVYSSII